MTIIGHWQNSFQVIHSLVGVTVTYINVNTDVRMQANLDLWKEEYRGLIFASEWGRTVCWWDTTWIIMNLIKSDRLSCIKVNINSIDNHHFNNWEEVDLTAPSQLHHKSKSSASLFHLLELIPEKNEARAMTSLRAQPSQAAWGQAWITYLA